MIVVIGCPRSGTRFTSHLFKEHGFDVGHEVWGKDGIVSWQLTGNDNYWKIHANQSVVHQVRHPLAVISSLETISLQSWQLMAKSIPLNIKEPIRRSMQVYLHWNQLAQKRTGFRYQVENIREEYQELCYLAGFISTLNPKFVTSDKINSRPHKNLTWDDLKKADEDLENQLRILTVEYGYTP